MGDFRNAVANLHEGSFAQMFGAPFRFLSRVASSIGDFFSRASNDELVRKAKEDPKGTQEAFNQASRGRVYVSGYHRADGTYVQSYFRNVDEAEFESLVDNASNEVQAAIGTAQDAWEKQIMDRYLEIEREHGTAVARGAIGAMALSLPIPVPGAPLMALAGYMSVVKGVRAIEEWAEGD